MIRRLPLFPFLYLFLFLSACTTADPAAVARAVNATLTAAPTHTPVVVVVTVLGQTLVIPTVTPAPSDTPMPEVSPTPTVEATPTAPPVALGDVILLDDFSDAARWPASDDEFQNTALQDGALVLTLKQPEHFTLAYNNTRLARDFYASVTGQASACAERDRYGLLFRVQDAANYYQFQVDCDGRYRVVAVVDGELKILRDWTASDAVRAGSEANTLGVRVQGNTIEVFANGQSLIEVSDATFIEGGFGLYAGSGSLSKTYAVTFDDLGVWMLK
jgi:hypothetical protein